MFRAKIKMKNKMLKTMYFVGLFVCLYVFILHAINFQFVNVRPLNLANKLVL